MKGGTKPCYRAWTRSQTSPKPISIEDKPVISMPQRSVKLQEIKNNFQKDCSHIKKHIKTTTYKLGKTNKKIGVLIKDRNTRKQVQKEQALLKKQGIMEIKNFLRKKNLLRTGSSAPNDVIRQTYEQAILSGDVNNKSGETLVHNFLN
tara:strand:- start:3101 stop:3544 length:444 start_codon:yes stop_codon:yes gene_type:complete